MRCASGRRSSAQWGPAVWRRSARCRWNQQKGRMVPSTTTFGESGLPRIGRVSGRVAIAFGCFGNSAKCSDEMGCLGGVALLGDTVT